MAKYQRNLCAQCGATIIAAEWSEYLSDRCVRNAWSCDDCGYHFEVTIYFTPAEAARGLELPEFRPERVPIRLSHMRISGAGLYLRSLPISG